MPFPDATSANTFAFWRDCATRDPAAAAALLHQRVDRLGAGEQRAILASVPGVRTLTDAFAASIRRGGPLAGVPFMVKDLFAIEGHCIGAGSAFMAATRDPEVMDAPIVTRLRREGAVFAGITHLHEFAFGITGENPHFGDCPNPRLPDRLSGGSSSGSVAAVAAGLVPLAIGTDTGGSIRVPAAFCGVWGHRGTPHHEFTQHCFPLAPSFDAAGWFTATKPDLLTTLRALYGPAPFKPTTKPLARIPSLLLPSEIEPSFAEHLDTAARELAEPLPDDLLRAYLAATEASAAAFTTIQGREAAAVHEPWLDTRREAYDPVVWARLDRGRKRGDDELAAARATRARIRTMFETIFDRFSGLVMAASPFPALAKAGATEQARTRILQLTTPCSHAGLPALAVPVGLPDGTCGGLQVITPEPLTALAAL